MKNTQIKPARQIVSMPETEYRMVDAISSTDLRMIAKSPRNYWLYKQGTMPVTDSMHFGTAFHMAILEPDLFFDTYVVEPDAMPDGRKAGVGEGKINRLTNEWKAFIKEWRDKNGLKVQIQSEEFELLKKMMTAVHSHPTANALLESHDKEKSALWTNNDGIKCKGRADLIGEYLVDFKTTTCETPREFEAECYRRLIHSQSAFYDEGFTACNAQPKGHIVIGVEKGKGSEVSCFVMKMDPTLLERGYELNKKLLARLVECKKTNVWPGFNEVYPLLIPSWAIIDIIEE